MSLNRIYRLLFVSAVVGFSGSACPAFAQEPFYWNNRAEEFHSGPGRECTWVEEAMDFKVIDADGHVIEDESLFEFLDSSYRERDHQLSWDRLFPSLDFHHIERQALLSNLTRRYLGWTGLRSPGQLLDFTAVRSRKSLV